MVIFYSFRCRHFRRPQQKPSPVAVAVAAAATAALPTKLACVTITTTTVEMESSGVIIEEQKLMTEAKYRVYMSNIDKALKNFEYSSEWADLISALGKLNKVSGISTFFSCAQK